MTPRRCQNAGSSRKQHAKVKVEGLRAECEEGDTAFDTYEKQRDLELVTAARAHWEGSRKAAETAGALKQAHRHTSTYLKISHATITPRDRYR